MKRLLAILMLLASTASAQSSKTTDVAVVITSSKFEDPSITDDDTNTISFGFDEKTGYGVSVNHYWTSAFSTELALHRLSADLSVNVNGEPTLDIGELEARTLTGIAQWHFLRDSRFSPYLGAGIARVQGSFDALDDDEGEASFDFEDETTWVANFGADINISDTFAIVLDGKYLEWEPVAEGDADDEAEAVDVSPLMLSAGVRIRF